MRSICLYFLSYFCLLFYINTVEGMSSYCIIYTIWGNMRLDGFHSNVMREP
jgi:hypothetical protein